MGLDEIFEREDQHGFQLLETDNEGNETAGQLSAWLLLLANLPIAISIIIKSANRFIPLGAKVKSSLANFNRLQKKHLMLLHYYLNPAIVGVIVWHYASSRCKSTFLPDLGLILMVGIMALGVLIKTKLCPTSIRKKVFQIHTQPMIFLAMILALAVGHLIID